MSTCSIDECDRKVVGRGLCRMHYLQQWRAGKVTDQPLRGRERRECPTEGHDHTADGCWAKHGCRCDRCTHDRKMDRQRRRNRLRAYGREDQIRPERVPAAPVREHLLALLGQGFGLERIADAAGVPRSTLMDLKFGRRGAGREGQERVARTVRRDYAAHLLALTADDIEPAVLSSTGTVRRLQALCVIGWTQTEIAERIGMNRGNLSPIMLGLRARVTASTAKTAAAMFDDMWDELRLGPWAENAKRIAARRGWVGPLGWDDIDHDPAPAEVEETEQTKGERLLEDVEWLLEGGESPETVAAELGRRPDAIAKLATRHGRRDLARPFETIGKAAAA